jgi:2-oxoisovalerate dehydrogenase E1 component alpha subunit
MVQFNHAGSEYDYSDDVPKPSIDRSGLSLCSGQESLSLQRCRELHATMVRARALEEGLIRMCKSGQSYFWIGGPGEEAFNVALGMQVKRGSGPAYDYLHLHYRSSAILVALGMPLIDAIRQAAMRATDPFSMGRNFLGHFSVPAWNVVPMSSVVENQFAIAPGTALVQRRFGGDGITIVNGGDAGTAQGDFASCMIWSTRPDNQLPLLMITNNNQWGISTAAGTQHGERYVTDRGKAFGIPGEVVDGNDPIASWHAIDRGMTHCRRRRHPYMLQANVSRLYGHSSASGAARSKDEPDCIVNFEKRLLAAAAITAEEIERIHAAAAAEVQAAVDQALDEPQPTVGDLYRHTFAPSPVDAVYGEGCRGLPE